MTALSTAHVRNSASTLPGLLANSASPANSSSSGADAPPSFSQMLRDSSQAAPLLSSPMPVGIATASEAPKPAAPPPTPQAAQGGSVSSNVSSADGKTPSQREEARLNAKRNAGAPAPAPAPQRASLKMQPDSQASGTESSASGRAGISANARADRDADGVAGANGIAEDDALPIPDDADNDDTDDTDDDGLTTLDVFSVTVSTSTLASAPEDTPAAASLAAALANAGAAPQADAGAQAEAAELGTGRAVRGVATTSTSARAAALQLGTQERHTANANTEAKADAKAPADALTEARGPAGAFAIGSNIDTKAAPSSSFASALLDAGQRVASNSGEGASSSAFDAGLIAGAAGAADLKPAQALNGGTGKPETATSVNLPQAINDPSFAPAMAARLSLLAADGVTEAKLHLNPAEMGPVAVQIVVDGQQAQISFHAEQAETRSVLERSLPDLAAALRDNGLTLSGGGVFQQARDPGQNASGRESAAASRSAAARGGVMAVDATDSALSSAKRVSGRSRGVVDLYA